MTKMTKQTARWLRELAYEQGLPWAAWAKGQWKRITCEDCGATLVDLPGVTRRLVDPWVCTHGFLNPKFDFGPMEIPDTIEQWALLYDEECNRLQIDPVLRGSVSSEFHGQGEWVGWRWCVDFERETAEVHVAKIATLKFRSSGRVSCHMDYGDAAILARLAEYLLAIEHADRERP